MGDSKLSGLKRRFLRRVSQSSTTSSTTTHSHPQAAHPGPAPVTCAHSHSPSPQSSADHHHDVEPKAQPLPRRPSTSSRRSLHADHPISDSPNSAEGPSTDVKNASTKTTERPVTSGGGSTKSGDLHTLESSTWTFTSGGPPNTEPLEVVLVEPTPDEAVTSPPLKEIQDSGKEPEVPPQPSRQSSDESTMPLPPRKVWVRRNGAAATLVLTKADDLVDEVKEMILKRYGNSLGKHFDAPDVSLKLIPRDHPHQEHVLNPDEVLWETLEKAYPDGQKMDEALIIQVPSKRTPKHSPGGQMLHHHHAYFHMDDGRPHENGTDYFPPMPPAAVSPGSNGVHDSRYLPPEARAISVLTTGQVPPLISPGGTRRALIARQPRPNFARQHTASPTALSASTSSRANRPRLDSSASDKRPSPITTSHPTPPIVDSKTIPKASPRISSPRPQKNRRARKSNPTENGESATALPPSFIDTAVPPINILIVEDNIINMKLLEQFVRRLNVHWATAVNGREAVDKWRLGGFHLVLMDIQLPIMSGLEATREIRRLERVNHIGVLSSSSHSNAAPDVVSSEDTKGEIQDEDKLQEAPRLFKSPVIIVALTASNLQSDRHEALAAGCNDFLTKPVNFAWFERKVKEWGCMQALIDFDGWRKWKDAAIQNGLKDASTQDPRMGSLRRRKAAAMEQKTEEKDKVSSEETVTRVGT